MHHGFEFMKTIRSFAQDIEQEIDFAGRCFFQRHLRMALNRYLVTLLNPSAKKKKRQHRNVGAISKPVAGS